MRELFAGVGAAAVVILLYYQSNLIPLLILAGVLLLLFNFSGIKTMRLTAVGKRAHGKQISFNEIGGQETAKKELLEALDFVMKPHEVKHMGIRPLKGVMLVGPPGTGKTLLAKAAAGYTGSSFLSVAGSEFIEVYAGVGAQRVRQLFNQCRQKAKNEGRNSAILFIDEIDILGGQRGRHSSHLEYDQTLNQLLVEMDGLNGNDGLNILVIGATNRPEALDTALLRPGRFDRVVQVDLPDLEGREQILELHLHNKPVEDNISLEKIARETFGFSGAHLESLANEAAILAMREGRRRIGEKHLLEAIDKVIMGEKLERKPGKEEMWRIAVHETGHALVSEELKPGSVSQVTITPRGKALGYVRHQPERDYYIYTADHLEKQIAVLLGGTGSEKLVLGNRSTGSLNDFKQAVELAKKIIAAGLSSLGVVSIDDLPVGLLHRTIQQIIAVQEKRVADLLASRVDLIKEIARIIIEKEKISGDTLRRHIFSSTGQAC
ncbi:MAG TPA: AAA family ATPase [Bacillota bacterium]|jgi:cell division protease FtsH|nr:AAA family ATPase [Bacillota bacterium]HOA34963.1 AAA family ATPase [Bacillota bacterium]HOJ83197.1 AAA family ATPase [Bacillota bacterium]HOL14709.1 AAA family ATPase [Bacillota bacterium]HPZ11120.1 AAA family ATPase [Bacillota bacterium]